MTRERYKRRYGAYPAIQPQIEGETLDTNLARYQDIRDGLDRLKRCFEQLRMALRFRRNSRRNFDPNE